MKVVYFEKISTIITKKDWKPWNLKILQKRTFNYKKLSENPIRIKKIDNQVLNLKNVGKRRQIWTNLRNNIELKVT